jgi:hypothetical protein
VRRSRKREPQQRAEVHCECCAPQLDVRLLHVAHQLPTAQPSPAQPLEAVPCYSAPMCAPSTALIGFAAVRTVRPTERSGVPVFSTYRGY